ncbi:unnamed protein product, partial [Mesorhabditis spiculigera]
MDSTRLLKPRWNRKRCQLAKWMPGLGTVLIVLLLLIICCLQNERSYFSTLVQALTMFDARFSRRILGNEEPFVFVGGMPRSGTTLMRAMLDAHERIRCGEETMVIPWILKSHEEWVKRRGITEGSGLSEKVLDEAVSAFISEDPFALFYVDYLADLFPESKYILMLRDARATVHSVITREVPISGFNRTNYEQCFQAWNGNMRKLVSQCRGATGRCLMVHYESLVQSPREQMAEILAFLEEPWSENVLQHEKFVGGEVMLNPNEFSTNQVVQRVNLKAMTAWKGFFNDELLGKIPRLAPMMASLGYDPFDLDPDYAKWALTTDKS